jgi:hypothetical protein
MIKRHDISIERGDESDVNEPNPAGGVREL